MKKLFAVLAALMAFTFVSCGTYTDSATVNDVHIPAHVSHIEFWNGGTCIGKYDNAKVEFVIKNSVHRTMSLTKENTRVVFYRYDITVDGRTESIIDSEALAIKYTE